MEARKFRQKLERFSAPLAELSQRLRAGMAALLNRSSLQEKTAGLIERRCLAPVIERDILLVTDAHPADRAFSLEAGISHRAVSLSSGVRVAGALHIENGNAYHNRFKEWLRRSHGLASRYLRLRERRSPRPPPPHP